MSECPARFRLQLLAILVVLVPTAVRASEDDAIARGDSLISNYCQHIHAIQSLLDLEIRHRKSVNLGLAELHREGHASNWEIDRAHCLLSQLVQRRKATERFLHYLSRYQKVADDRVQEEIGWIVVNFNDHADLLATIPSSTIVIPSSEARLKLCKTIQEKLAEERETHARISEVRRGLYQDRLERTKRLFEGRNDTNGEVLQLRYLTAKEVAKIAVIRSQPSTLWIAHHKCSIEIDGRIISDWGTLLSELNQEWQACLAAADRAESIAELELLRVYRDRLAKLEADGVGRPGEFANFRKTIQRLEAVSTQPVATNQALFPMLYRQSQRQLQAAEERVAIQRHLVSGISQLASEDSYFANESRWQQSRASLAEAECQVAEHRFRQLQIASQRLASRANELVTREGTRSSSHVNSLEFLRARLAADLDTNVIHAGRLQVKLAKDQFDALELLHAEGHASWWELASAESDWHVKQFELEADQYKQQWMEALLKLLDQMKTTSHATAVEMRRVGS